MKNLSRQKKDRFGCPTSISGTKLNKITEGPRRANYLMLHLYGTQIAGLYPENDISAS